MRTITFYSYKGGVGRSLLVANTAKYLSTLGKKVFALDLDLEAPGLHYKFELGPDSEHTPAAPGVVDMLAHFLTHRTLPSTLADFSTQVSVADGAGPIRIMRAGTAPQGDYWRLLSQISWYDLFYGHKPMGAPFFLELQERVRVDFQPDFLLVDARTGITEMGGVATTILPDTVVCLALNSFEHLEGLRAVMQGIARTTARERTPVRLLPVISRLSVQRSNDVELDSIRSYLSSPIQKGEPNLQLEDVIILHSEPFLDSREQLLVGGKDSPHEVPLLRDYLRLFSKIIPAEEIRPYVGKLIGRAVGLLLDDPDTAQGELEALTTYCADQEAYRALLKLYQVRKAPIEKSLATARLMWQLAPSNAKPDQLLLDIVKTGFAEPRSTEFQKTFAEFAEAIWRADEMKDIRIGLSLASAYLPERRGRAIQLLLDYVDKVDSPQETAVVRLLELLRTGLQTGPAFRIVERFKGIVQAAEFQNAWAKLVADQKDIVLTNELLADPLFRSAVVRASDPATLYRLHKLVGEEAANQVLEDAVEGALATGHLPQLRSIAEIYQEEGRLRELEARMRGRFPAAVIDETMDIARRRLRRGRAAARFIE